MERGCLSEIKVGRGTNRNERFHRQLNCVLKANRYGPEMANALITLVSFKHNERYLAKADKRIPKPMVDYLQKSVPVKVLVSVHLMKLLCPNITLLVS